MNVQRGEVVLVDYPYAAGGGAKVRPISEHDRGPDHKCDTTGLGTDTVID